MIARQAPAANWQRALGDAVSSIGELLDLLALLPEELPVHLRPADAAARDFPLRVPRGFVSRMQLGDPADPLLLQVLPTATELVAAPGYTADPLAETGEAAAVSPLPGLLHKYRGRALLVVSGACGVHCRYCFRRHFPYGEHALRGDRWEGALEGVGGGPGVEGGGVAGGEPGHGAGDPLRRRSAGRG